MECSLKEQVAIGNDYDCVYECKSVKQIDTGMTVGEGEQINCDDVSDDYSEIWSRRITNPTIPLTDIPIPPLCSKCPKTKKRQLIITVKGEIFVKVDCNRSDCRKKCDENAKHVENLCGKIKNPAVKQACKIAAGVGNVGACHVVCDSVCKGG